MKTKSNKIKQVTRMRIPETNSSSSHTLTIYGDVMMKKDEIISHSGLVSEDGKILTIPGGNDEDFGRYSADFNDLIHKLQYATAGIDYYPERKVILENVLKNYLGIENVIYDWYDEAMLEEWGDKNPDKTFDECPFLHKSDGSSLSCPNYVDHESTDLIEKYIYESEHTLRDFLFSDNSWIFCGECEVTTPQEKFPNLEIEKGEGVYFILDPEEKQADPNKNIGKIEVNLFPNFPYDIYTLQDVSDNYWKKMAERPWIEIDYKESSWCDNESEFEKLATLWIERNSDTKQLEMKWGKIPKHKENVRIYVPQINSETFKYPYKLKFVDINYFGELFNLGKVIHVAGEPDEIVFTLKLSIPNLEIDEYV